MTARTPLYLTSGNLRGMSSADMSVQTDMAVYQWSLNPSVTISRNGSNSGNLPGCTDSRYQAGASTTDATDYDTEAETPTCIPLYNPPNCMACIKTPTTQM